jgi:4-hydroxybenzoate polyprenyltransferase
LWPDAFHKTFSKKTKELQAYIEMARLVNVIPSFLMVLVGALSSARSPAVLLKPTVWVIAMVSAGIAVSSVVVNDYFDFRLGVDTLNAPEKPLPRCVCFVTHS